MRRSERLPAVLLLALGVAIAPPALAESTFEEEIRLLAELLKIEPGSVVADIGAGEGEHGLGLANVPASRLPWLLAETGRRRLRGLLESAPKGPLAKDPASS